MADQHDIGGKPERAPGGVAVQQQPRPSATSPAVAAVPRGDETAIDDYRRRIDQIDDQLMKLLNSRSACAVEIGRLKRRVGAPGVYTAQGKIASLGLRVKQGRSYHGLALNIDMDLTPFSRIDPCGYPGQSVTQLADLGVRTGLEAIGRELAGKLTSELGYTGCHPSPDQPPFSSL